MSEAFYAVAEPRASSGEAYPMPEAFYWLLLWSFQERKHQPLPNGTAQNSIRGIGMSEAKQNYYGGLCTEMYEILHEKAPQDRTGLLPFPMRGKDKENP